MTPLSSVSVSRPYRWFDCQDDCRSAACGRRCQPGIETGPMTPWLVQNYVSEGLT